jgi:hypothetical protein
VSVLLLQACCGQSHAVSLYMLSNYGSAVLH